MTLEERKCEDCAHYEFNVNSSMDSCQFSDELKPCDKYYALDWLYEDMEEEKEFEPWNNQF